MNKLISIIVPAYNTENYIEDMLICLENQTYKNLQIIVIDDGSTDKTASIILKYAKKDSRIEYYYQKNSGVSAARNEGLKKVKGEKIFFFDSDDTFVSELIKRCVDFSNDNNVETVIYGYSSKSNGIVGKQHKFELSGCYRGGQIKNVLTAFIGHSYEDINAWIKGEKSLREGKEHTALWRIMLDAETVLQSKMEFKEDLSIGEDTRFINEYLLRTTSVGVLEETLYYLTIREGSANITNNLDPQLMTLNKLKLIEARKEIEEIARDISCFDINPYWQGTLVLSAVQLALKLSNDKNQNHSKKENLTFLKMYLNNSDVKKGIMDFKPDFGIKAIPFVALKYLPKEIVFYLCCLLPNKLVKKIT